MKVLKLLLPNGLSGTLTIAVGDVAVRGVQVYWKLFSVGWLAGGNGVGVDADAKSAAGEPAVSVMAELPKPTTSKDKTISIPAAPDAVSSWLYAS